MKMIEFTLMFLPLSNKTFSYFNKKNKLQNCEYLRYIIFASNCLIINSNLILLILDKEFLGEF